MPSWVFLGVIVRHRARPRCRPFVVTETEEKLMSLPAHVSIPAQRRPIEDDECHGSSFARSAPPAGALALLVRARSCLHDAERHSTPRERYVAAHLAALRAATAVLVARAREGDGAGPTSVWTLLGRAAPELREWALLFAAGSERRAMAEAGIPGVSANDADLLVHHAREFLDVVGRSLSGVTR